MLMLIIKLILLFFGLCMFGIEISPVLSITAFLSALILTSLNQYLDSKRFTLISSAFYCTVCFFLPVFCPFLPMFCFDLLMSNQRAAALFTFVPCIALYMSNIVIAEKNAVNIVFLLLLTVLSALMQYIYKKAESLAEENKRIRDNSAELNRMLAEKNKSLLEKYNYEIHLATLKERNRIAREIHDNVGHILSRSLLQTGALQAINMDRRLSEHLAELKNTLSIAMDSIRNSVHGLHDESLDLYESIRKMTEHPNYKINIDYDAAQDLPNNIKYCFLAVIKEAFTNIAKHSDANRVHIAVQEHPAIYQLLIQDNGSKKTSANINAGATDTGMGLYSMEERVASCGGHFSAEYKNGFRIFISIPKKEDKTDGD